MSELTCDRPPPLPGPSIRREHGIADARAGRFPMSSDRHYLTGYELGRRLFRPDAPPRDDAPAEAAEG